jgi:hypothetical protein
MAKNKLQQQESDLSIGLGEGSCTLTKYEAEKLARLKDHEGWPILLDVLKAMQEGCTVMLRDRTRGLEDLRFTQGMSEAAGRIADLVQEDVPLWYKETIENKESEENA